MQYITLPSLNQNELLNEFKEYIENLKTNESSINFKKDFKDLYKIDETKIEKPYIYFSLEAWAKMKALVEVCEKEIAWQATVLKKNFKNSKKFYYYIDKVFVYPQEVSPTFVDVDPVKYTEWSMKLEDDIYNNLRCQGHSHVNMGVTPSGTDTNTYQMFLNQLKKDDFYIFIIMNKRGDVTINVYDFAQNIIFETKDCTVDILTSAEPLKSWLKKNMENITEKKVITAANYADYDDYYSKYSGYSGYSGYYQTKSKKKYEKETKNKKGKK